MLRLLHLLQRNPDHQTEVGVGQLNRNTAGFASEARTIGWGGTYATALAAIVFLRREKIEADVVHAWGEIALTVAAVGSSLRIVYSPCAFPSRRSVRWLRSVMDYRDVQVICPTEVMRRAFVERGVPMGRCHLIRPAVEFSRIKPGRDASLRTALGFDADDFVIVAPGESTRAADHERALWAAVLLHVMDARHKLLLWGRGPLAESARKFAGKLGQPGFFRDASERLGTAVPFEALLPAADLALVTAAGPVATLPIAMCMAARLPIVSVVTPTIAELLEDRHNALMVGSRLPRQLARRVMDLREDPSLQWSLCDRARTEAYEYFAQSRFVEEFRSVYEQCASTGDVQLPPLIIGAGSRFHGVA